MRLHGGVGWLVLVGFIVYWDLYHHTLSGAFWQALAHDKWRYVAIIGWAVVTAHLFDVLNPRYDLIRHIGRFIGRLLGR